MLRCTNMCKLSEYIYIYDNIFATMKNMFWREMVEHVAILGHIGASCKNMYNIIFAAIKI